MHGTAEQQVPVEEYVRVASELAETRRQRDALDHKLARLASLPDLWEEQSHEWFLANALTYEPPSAPRAYEAGWDNAAELLRRELAK